MSNSNSSYKFDPLNGNNYTAWSGRMEIILDDLDLWDIAAGIQTKPIPVDANTVTGVEQQAIVAWEKKNKKARKERNT